MSEEKSLESLINFPCEFPIKILGKDSDVFEIQYLNNGKHQKCSEIRVKKITVRIKIAQPGCSQ